MVPRFPRPPNAFGVFELSGRYLLTLAGLIVAFTAVAFVVRVSVEGGESDEPLVTDWLTPEDQEDLADAVSTHSPGSWVAGCLLEGRDRRDIDDVIDAPGEATRWRTKTRSGREISMVFVENQEHESGSYVEVWAAGAFCYVPE